MNRPTVHDIAREAGVSLATVDRVLNERVGVRQRTIDRVLAAAERLGYVRDTSAANLARQRQYRFTFVLPEGPSEFVEALVLALEEAYSSHMTDRTVLDIVRVPPEDPHAIVRTLRALAEKPLDGVALMVPETPQVRDAVARLKQAGLVVVSLVSDLPNSRRDYFIGINSVAAGRTAALLMGRFSGGNGEVLVVANSMRSRDNLERRIGFDAIIGQEFPGIAVLPSVEAHDDPVRMQQVVQSVLDRRPALVGIYSVGADNAALLQTLNASGRIRSLTIITHELTPATRQALVDSRIEAVIAQNEGHLVRSAIRVLRTLSDGLSIYEAQERVRIEIVVRENLP